MALQPGYWRRCWWLRGTAATNLPTALRLETKNIYTYGSDTVSFLFFVFLLVFFYFLFLLQYYYSVKILHGQDPSCVWVGWVTSNFRPYDRTFDPERVCSVTVTLGDQWGKVLERLMTSSLCLYHILPRECNRNYVVVWSCALAPGCFDVCPFVFPKVSSAVAVTWCVLQRAVVSPTAAVA